MNNDIAAPVSIAAALKAATNADQVEADAIRQGIATVASCLTDDRIAYDSLPEEYDAATIPSGNPEWAEEDGAGETAVGDTIAEIERRIALLGEQYPFELSSDLHLLTFKADRAPSGVYQFCLAVAVTQQDLAANPACQAVREFERLVGRLLKRFLHGDYTESYRSGAPANGDRPPTMSEMLIDLHKRTEMEWEFHPSQEADAQAEQGDGGIDVVVWKWFGDRDRRIGKPFLLAQCACGDDDYWFDKRNELNIEGFETTWSGTVSFAGALKCLATPRHIPHPARWREGTSKGGILLDRIRLTWMGEACLDTNTRAECKAKLAPHTNILNQKPAARVKISQGGLRKSRRKRAKD